jgi:hypothetical protein
MHAATGPGSGGGRRGATAVETAVVLNLALLMVLGLFECSRLLMVRHLLDNAARAAARVASSGSNDKTEEEVRDVAERMLVGERFDGPPRIRIFHADLDGIELGPWKDAGFGEGIAVQIEVDYRPLVPSMGIFPSPIPLSARSVMRSEGA